MKKIILLLLISIFTASTGHAQDFTLKQMMKFSKLKSANFEKTMKAKGYTLKMIDSSNNSEKSTLLFFDWIFYKENLPAKDTSFVYLNVIATPDSIINSISCKVNEEQKDKLFKKINNSGFVSSDSLSTDVYDRDTNVIAFKSVTNYYKNKRYEIAINERLMMPKMESEKKLTVSVSYQRSIASK